MRRNNAQSDAPSYGSNTMRKVNLGALDTQADLSPPTHKDIELRAYEIYLQRRGEDGNELNDWLAAEKELTESLPMDTSEPKVPDVIPLRKRAAVS